MSRSSCAHNPSVQPRRPSPIYIYICRTGPALAIHPFNRVEQVNRSVTGLSKPGYDRLSFEHAKMGDIEDAASVHAQLAAAPGHGFNTAQNLASVVLVCTVFGAYYLVGVTVQ